MYEVTLYFKVFGLAVDNAGAPQYGGASNKLGVMEHSYDEVVAAAGPNIKQWFLAQSYLGDMGFTENSVELITKDEYERDYVEDDDNGN